jgi:large subunit ribosomal protein L25
MKSVKLSGSLRANVGKTDAAALRAKGMVPCVIYGTGEQIHFSADIRHFKNIIFTPDTNLVDVEIDGKTYKTVLQEAQYHKINDNLIHADFLQVTEDKPVTVQLPVKAIGQSQGVKDGGKMTIKMRKLKVRGLLSKLPESIDLNVEKLVIGKSIAAGDIHIDGITLLHPKNISVISVDVTRAAVLEEVAPTAGTAPAAGAAAPAAGAAAPAAGAKAPAAAGAKPAAPAGKK